MVVGRIMRNRVTTVAASGVCYELPEESVSDDGGVVLFPLSPNQVMVSEVGGALYRRVTVHTPTAVLVPFQLGNRVILLILQMRA